MPRIAGARGVGQVPVLYEGRCGQGGRYYYRGRLPNTVRNVRRRRWNIAEDLREEQDKRTRKCLAFVWGVWLYINSSREWSCVLSL